jgi:NAD(P)-dependent dehydrogenase (short-subunit alcohol dehydrogenase family)
MKIFITGSTDGLGMLAAKQLAHAGHDVFLHARNDQRAAAAIKNIPAAKNVMVADLSVRSQTIILADQINREGSFDAIIHNAGVYQADNKLILEVNTIAPYILTCLVKPPSRLIYLSSGMHLQGDPGLKKLETAPVTITYSDSKLHMLLLAFAVSRRWPLVYSNAVNPGWVPTRMGGRGAPDDLQKGYETQAWLASSEDAGAKTSGHYFFHKKPSRFLPEAAQIAVQERFLTLCEQLTGTSFP